MASQRIRRSGSGIDARGRNGARHAVDVVRIDQQRGVELVGGAGEFRQHQHAGIGRVLGCDIFLGDQVHAVLQRRHHADLRGAIEPGKHGLAKALVEIADRRPVDLAVNAVDVGDELCDFALQVAVGLDRAARGRCDLQQRDGALELRVQRPHPVERLDAVDQPFRIVEPVDTDRELLAVEAVAQPRHVRMGDRLGGLLGEFFQDRCRSGTPPHGSGHGARLTTPSCTARPRSAWT